MFSNFQEDYFENEPVKLEKQVRLVSYNAKVCEPKWFMSDCSEEDKDAFIERLKFKADYLYSKKQYADALHAYDKYLKDLAGNSTQMKRDFLEGKARCQLRCGQFNDALQTTKALEKEVCNFDHLTVLCLLQCDIYQATENFEAMETTLMKLLVIHPFSSNSWICLGKCFKQMIELGIGYRVKACICLLRARFLLEAGKVHLNSFEAVQCNKNLVEISTMLNELDNANNSVISAEAIEILQERHLGKEESSSSKLPSIDFFSDEVSVKEYFNTKWLRFINS